jgi:XTP/dITP diphosphohydrolase
MCPIVLATANPHKIEELRAIFAGVGIPVIGLGDVAGSGRFAEPAETGSSFHENAAIKAVSYAAQTGLLCLADDSGLEVDALGGAPGVISSHYSTDGRETGLSRGERDAANNLRLLRELDGVPWRERTARFLCVMTLALPDVPNRVGLEARPHGNMVTATGTLEGRIGIPPSVPRGSNGFGYDPLFVLPDDRTSAELSPAEKNAVSHRAVAAQAMAARIIESGVLLGP